MSMSLILVSLSVVMMIGPKKRIQVRKRGKVQADTRPCVLMPIKVLRLYLWMRDGAPK